MTDATLAGLRVLVTRPSHQADHLCRMIEERGGRTQRLPLLSIEPVAQNSALQKLFEAAREFDWWIFTSVNAVEHARAWLHRGSVNFAAIGSATAAALHLGGHAAATPPGAYTSEGLLELPQFQDLRGRSVLLVTGEGGRGLLAAALAARGARVETAAVYRRLPLPYDGARVAELLRACDAMVVTSGEALAHLLRLTPETARPGLLKKRLVVPGPRVVEEALQAGFRSPLAPEKMTDDGIVAALERMHSSKPTP